MKANPTKGLIVFALLSVLFFIVIVVMNNLTIKQQGGHREEENDNRNKKYWQSGADRQLGMFFQTRAYPDPYFINEKFAAAWQHAKAMRPPTDHSRAPGQRTNLGGWASLNGPYVGRVISIAIHPTTTSTVFIGTASGGIWKTTNSGTNWSFVPTNESVLGVPTIVFHP